MDTTSPLSPHATAIVAKLSGWANQMAARYGFPVYLVGSALTEPAPRDVDVRVVLSDEAFYARYGIGCLKADGLSWEADPPEGVRRWRSDMAKMTRQAVAVLKLNLDFQIQGETVVLARCHHEKPRVRLDVLDIEETEPCAGLAHLAIERLMGAGPAPFGRPVLQRTQTSLHPEGNCWQTCVACILGVEPEELPDQAALERVPPGETYGKGYGNALGAYLRDHHGLFYIQQDPHEVLPFARLREPGYHMLVGPTPRTPETGAFHVVVGRHGEIVWDPHPSHAGLTDVTGWGFLVPFPEKWAKAWFRIPCVCPRCAPPSDAATP